MIQTFEALVNDILPIERARLKPCYNPGLVSHQQGRVESNPARSGQCPRVDDAKVSAGARGTATDKFSPNAMAYSMIFMPNYGDKGQMLHHHRGQTLV